MSCTRERAGHRHCPGRRRRRAPHRRRRGQRTDLGVRGGGCASSFGVELDVVDYAEHAIGRGAEATAAAYVESIAGSADNGGSSETRWGIGIDPDITTAGLKAVLGALERHQR